MLKKSAGIRRFVWMICLFTGCASDGSQKKTEEKMVTPSRESAEPERSDVATPRTIEQPWMSLADWRSRHERQLVAPKRRAARVVFLGDSIVEGWCGHHSFEQRFGRYVPLCLGIGGDQTQHVLWRIENGALGDLQPRLVVLLIGVNNLGNGHSPESTVAGIRALCASIQTHLPDAQILLLAILPSGERPDDPLRKNIAVVNEKLTALAQSERIAVRDVGAVMIEPDGSIAATTMADFLHPTSEGYGRLTNAVAQIIGPIMGK